VERHSKGSLFEAKLPVDLKLIRSLIGFHKPFNYSGKEQLDFSSETSLGKYIKKKKSKKTSSDSIKNDSPTTL